MQAPPNLEAMLQNHLNSIEEKQAAFLQIVLTITRVATNKLFSLLLPFLATLGGFLLWQSVLPKPDTYQLVGLGLYGVLIQIPLLWRKPNG